MIPGLRGNHGLLHAHQELLRFRQRQPKIGDIAKVMRPTDLHHIDILSCAVGADFNQPQYPPHPQSPSRQRIRPVILPATSSPQSLGTPWAAARRPFAFPVWCPMVSTGDMFMPARRPAPLARR
jgi:hypothetical protein